MGLACERNTDQLAVWTAGAPVRWVPWRRSGQSKITIRTQAVVGGCRSCVRTLGTLEACWRSGRARRSETGALARAMALNICEDVWRKEEEGGEEEEEEEKTSRNEVSADSRCLRRGRLLRSAGCRRVEELCDEPRLTSVGNVQED
jgi:hypothetical protein